MKLSFSAASKTFLCGEYAVLAGAPALVLATEPRFEFRAVRGGSGISGIPEGSPAARWLAARSVLIDDWAIEFNDPHQGRGGFGASSAQFLFAHAFTTLLQVSVARAAEGLDLHALWNDFMISTEQRASGADVMAQAAGQVARFEHGQAQAGLWPFRELDFAIVRTQQKLATHSHLSDLHREPLQALLEPAKACVNTFVADSVELFLHNLRAFTRCLRDLNLQCAETLRFTTDLEAQGWCKLAKGCGALGADTILVLFAHADREVALAELAQRDLPLVATQLELSEGLRMEWNWN